MERASKKSMFDPSASSSSSSSASESSSVHILDKPIGYTPLHALQSFRIARGIAESERMSYAGRLDPMASGLLLLLQGELCDEQGVMQNHDKVRI